MPRLLALAAALLIVSGAAEARPRHARGHGAASTDSARVLARMAARDRLVLWPAWEERQPLARRLAPATREQVAAPPFTGWGYGATIPGASPGF
jgi:hypothetical protein